MDRKDYKGIFMQKTHNPTTTKDNNQTNKKPQEDTYFLALLEFRKQDTCLEFAAFVSKCKRQNNKELLIICGTPHGI